MTASQARAFLTKSEEYLASAVDNMSAGRYTPAAGDAVHAGISAKDGIVYADADIAVRVVGVQALPGHQMWLRFSTGEERRFDATPLLGSGVFARLKDEGVFTRVALDRGVPTWPDADVDLSPEYLYQESVPFGS